MRVGIIGLLHEANTFNPMPADLDAFQSVTGQDLITQYTPAHHEIGGFIEGLTAANIDIVPLFAARATPSGVVPRDTMAAMIKTIDEQLAAAGKLDGLLLAPHGAGVSEDYPDMDGYWMSHVREKVGKDLPLIATIDPHCNLSQLMVDTCNAIVAYRTNPHIDQRQRGLEAASLMARTLKGEIKPTMAAALPAIAIDMERQHTPSEPCVSLYKLANEILTRQGVLGDSVVLGFPYADVAEMGTAFIVITDNDKPQAQKLADELAKYLKDHRENYKGQYIEVSAAIQKTRSSAKPVCLLDMGDNVGGGAPGDYTLLAHALYEAEDLKSFISLVDAQTQMVARAAGVGATIHLDLAGHTDLEFGRPISGEFKIISLHDGVFTEDKPRHGGKTHYELGPTVIAQSKNLTVQITTIRSLPASLNQLLAFDLDPGQFDAIVAKGVHAPTAAFEPVCPTLIRVNTPGITCADMRKLEFKNRRRPLFPFEEV